jgi:hypothetical protein
MTFLTHQIFLLSGSIPILQGGPLFRGKTTIAKQRLYLDYNCSSIKPGFSYKK